MENLMAMEVTSVSKKEQKVSKTGAAVYVTQEDIRRSGVTNIPDLLRMVPGVEVASIDANAWAITIRGFNFRYSSKVLVLIDGRSVYSPAFSGVYSDQRTVRLEDVDRIEVIRGPGGTVWGANAVNGTINVITKNARATHGDLASFGSGSEESAQALLHHGASVGNKGAYRAKAEFSVVEYLPHTRRSDWNLSRSDTLTVQDDYFGALESPTINTLFFDRLPGLYSFDDKVRVPSANVLGRWNHAFSKGSEASVQLCYDGVRRLDQGLDTLHIGDIDFQYHFRAGSRNDVVTGGGYRLASTGAGFVRYLSPKSNASFRSPGVV